MSNSLKNILKNYANEINKIFGKSLSKIILYGSYARGDNNINSDIDIMILVSLDDMQIKEKLDEIAELSFEYDVKNNINLSPIVTSVENYNKYLTILPFYKNIEKEGVVLNG